MANGLFDERTVISRNRLFVPADTTSVVALTAVASGDTRIDAIMVSNRDGIAHVVNLGLTIGAVVTQLGSVSVPSGQGYLGTPSIDILAACLPATQVGYNLIAGATLGLSMAVAIVATFDVSVSTVGGAF